MTPVAPFCAPKLDYRQPSYQLPSSSTHYRRWTGWSGSVLVHGIIAAVVILRGGPPATPLPSSQQPPTTVLKARLLPAPRATRESAAAPPQTPSSPVLIDAAEPIAPGLQVNPTNTSTLPAADSAKLSSPDETLHHKARPAQLPSTASKPNTNTSAGSADEPVQSRYKTDMYRFLQQQAQAKDRELGRAAARDFARSHNTVTLQDNRKGKTEAPLTRAPKVRVNCTSALNKTLTVLSTMTGGRLDCSEPSSYAADYINKRVNAHSTQQAPPPPEN